MAIDIEKAKKEYFSLNATEDLDELQDIIKGWNTLEQKYQEENNEFQRHQRKGGGLPPIYSPTKSGGGGDPSSSSSSSSPTRIGALDTVNSTINTEIDPTDLIENVYIIDTPTEFNYRADQDGALETGTHQVEGGSIYTYKVFTRKNQTFLHVVDLNTERNLYMRIARDHFDVHEDVGLACFFFEAPQPGFDGSDGDSTSLTNGLPVAQAPILTGVSELEGGITVYEEPFGYQEPNDSDEVKHGKCSWKSTQITYRAFSVRGNTKIIAFDSQIGRRLFFTVNRTRFIEAKDMATAFQILGVIRQQKPVFVPADVLSASQSLPSSSSPTQSHHLGESSVGYPSPGGWAISPGNSMEDVWGTTSSLPATDGPAQQGLTTQRSAKEQKRDLAREKNRLRKQQRKLEKRLATKASPRSAQDDDDRYFTCCSCRGKCTCFKGQKGRVERMLEDVSSSAPPPVKGWRPTVNFSQFTTATASLISLDTDSMTGSMASMGSRGSRGSRGSALGSLSGSEKGPRAWSKGRAKIKGSFRYTNIDASFLHRDEMLGRTLKLASSPPVSTVLRWRSPGDDDALGLIDQKYNNSQLNSPFNSSFNNPFNNPSSMSVMSDDAFEDGLEQDSISFLDEKSATLGSTRGGSLSLSPLKSRPQPPKELLEVYGMEKRRMIELRAVKKAEALARALLGPPPPLRKGPLPFDVTDNYGGQDLNTARSEGSSTRSTRRPKTLASAKDDEGPPKPLEPLFEVSPPQKDARFNMKKLFALD